MCWAGSHNISHQIPHNVVNADRHPRKFQAVPMLRGVDFQQITEGESSQLHAASSADLRRMLVSCMSHIFVVQVYGMITRAQPSNIARRGLHAAPANRPAWACASNLESPVING